MNTSERIAKRRKELGLKLDDIAHACGVARSTASKWARGDIKDMRIDKLEPLAKILQTTIDWLLGLDEDYTLYENVERLPIPSELEILRRTGDEKKEKRFLKIPEYMDADFAVRFHGDSMINARIFDGDLVLIKAQPKVDNGDICAIIIDNEAYLKRIYKYDNRIELRPENPLFPVLNYEGEDMNRVRVIGKAIAFFSNIR